MGKGKSFCCIRRMPEEKRASSKIIEAISEEPTLLP
jgi:hypothetical protein